MKLWHNFLRNYYMTMRICGVGSSSYVKRELKSHIACWVVYVVPTSSCVCVFWLCIVYLLLNMIIVYDMVWLWASSIEYISLESDESILLWLEDDCYPRPGECNKLKNELE